MTEAKEQILKLAQQRNRAGKENLTDEEMLEQLYRIRDGAASWLEQCVIYAKKDGIKEAQMLFDHSNNQIRTFMRLKKDTSLPKK
jgi:hypothetical protein